MISEAPWITLRPALYLAYNPYPDQHYQYISISKITDSTECEP